MLNSLPVRLLWHSFSWLTRLAIVASAVMAVLIALSIVVLRYWLLPGIEQYHDRITASLTGAIGNQVSIGKIESDWQGFLPRVSFTDVSILNDQHQTALVLPRIDGSVSWLSLFTAELRLASLEIDKPELLIRRDAQGNISINGVALSRQGSDNDLANWLLHQSRIVARDALVVWLDEKRDAPPLVLRQVNLRIESQFSHHRFALRALPPRELSTPMDVRGDFYGSSFDDLRAWRGEIFTQLDYTDVTAWRPWLSLPDEFSRGRGALRGWLWIQGGKLARIAADMDLHGVVTRLGGDVPEMEVSNLRGRAAWKDVDGGLEVSARRLEMRLRNGLELQPTDFYFRTAKETGRQPAGGELRANSLQLETVVSLANFLPLDAGLRAQLDAYAPRGRVSNLDVQWRGQPGKLDSYKIKGSFDNIALRRVGRMPGFSGLTMDVDGNEDSGRLIINSRQLVVDAPDAMREALSFTSLAGQAGWQRKRGELLVTVDNVAVANDDLAGNLYGSYLTQAGTLGVLNLTAALTRGDVRRAARYTPLIALDREGNDWLNGALLAGHTEDFRVRIKGNLSDFPLDGTEDALLEIGGQARDVALEFDKNWPKIENINGEFWIRGNKLEVKAPSATTLGARLQNVDVTLPDMMSADLPLELKGEALAASDTFLQYIQQSPVRGYIDGFTDGMHAAGNGHLDLSARIPLMGDKPVKVSGTVKVHGNDIDLGEGVPMLRNTRGALSFNESGMHASGILANILGGLAIINVQTGEGGAVHASVKGHSSLDALRKTDPHPLLNYLRGGAAWDADISVVKKSVQLAINSDLQGISSTLPQPLAKRANESLPLHVAKSNVIDGQDFITAQMGKLLNMRLARRDENGVMVVKRGTVNFGGNAGRTGTQGAQQPPQGKDGVWLTGRLPALSLQGWGSLSGADGKAENGLPIAGIDMVIGKVRGYGLDVDNLSIDASKRGDGLLARLSSNTLNGDVEWQSRGNGKLTARFRNVMWNEDNIAKMPAQTINPSPVSPGNLPALQIAIENLQMDGKQIGRFDMVGHPDGRDWRLRRLNITNPDGSLVGGGVWLGDPAGPQTQVNLLLQISDAGKILARSGYPNTVKGGSGKLAANLSWTGAPDGFNYASLNGSLNLDTGKGQFLKMDPGAGKLLSILSLQSLPKRITLDFTDVFSEGFQFDSIKGNALIRNGVLDTQDLHLDGSSAKVTMKGSVDLTRETQDLRVRILPALGDSVSLLSAFAAGPVVGIGTLLASKVLGNPLDILMSFEYNISGTWANPKVEKLGQSSQRKNPVNSGLPTKDTE
jgi:uncharacterized protein (TIGR02099 family)